MLYNIALRLDCTTPYGGTANDDLSVSATIFLFSFFLVLVFRCCFQRETKVWGNQQEQDLHSKQLFDPRTMCVCVHLSHHAWAVEGTTDREKETQIEVRLARVCVCVYSVARVLRIDTQTIEIETEKNTTMKI